MTNGVLFAFFVLNPLAMASVFQDARQKCPQSAILWALLVFFTGFIVGGLLYLLLGRGSSSTGRTRGSNRPSARGERDDEPMNVDDSGPF